jgi:hypothetical protein
LHGKYKKNCNICTPGCCDISCSCGGTTSLKNRSKHERSARHIDHLKRVEARDENIEIKAGYVKCDCGSIVEQNGIYKHNKTKKHLAYLGQAKDKQTEEPEKYENNMNKFKENLLKSGKDTLARQEGFKDAKMIS